MRLLLFLCCLGLPITGHQPPAPRFSLQEAFPNLSIEQPVELIHQRDGANRVFVLSQPGVIHVFPNQQDVSQSQAFLDLTSGVVSGGERGLAGTGLSPKLPAERILLCQLHPREILWKRLFPVFRSVRPIPTGPTPAANSSCLPTGSLTITTTGKNCLRPGRLPLHLGWGRGQRG